MLTGLSIASSPRLAESAPRETRPRLFENVSNRAGIDFVNVSGDAEKSNITGSMGSGVALLDYDQDGDLDAYFVNGARTRGLEVVERLPNRLFRNLGGWSFLEVTNEAGVGDLGWGMGCAAGDFDNDGLPDLYVTNLGANVLYRNLGDGTFQDVTGAAGVGDPGFGTSAAWFDSEGDGDLDLYVVNYLDPSIRRIPARSGTMLHAPGVLGDIYCRFQDIPVFCGPLGLVGASDVFYRNEGDGRFALATHAAGFDESSEGYGLGVVTLDFDSDGLVDLYVANDATPNRLYRNQGGGRFEEVGLLAGVAYNGAGRAEAGMGVDASDLNGDGLVDLFVTNFSEENNTLYLNLGRGSFADQTDLFFPGHPSFHTLGWATRFLDLDLDGDEDLFVANGHVFPQIEGANLETTYRQENQVFENEGRRFVLFSLPEDDASRERESSRGAAFGDLDDDGQVDAVIVNIDSSASVLRNTGSLGAGRHWIGFRLIGRVANRDGYGARVKLSTGSLEATREVHTSGFLSSSDLRLHFGVNGHERVHRAVVLWPDGEEQELEELDSDFYYTVVQGVLPSVRAQRPVDPTGGRR